MTWNAKQNPIDGNWLVMDGDEPILNFYRDKDIADSVVMIVREAIEESEAENKRLRDALEKARMHGGEVEAICCMALSAEKPSEPGRELFESYRTNNPERLIAVALWKSWEEQSREVKDEWNAKALAALSAEKAAGEKKP